MTITVVELEEKLKRKSKELAMMEEGQDELHRQLAVRNLPPNLVP